MHCVHVKCGSYDSHYKSRVKVGGHGSTISGVLNLSF